MGYIIFVLRYYAKILDDSQSMKVDGMSILLMKEPKSNQDYNICGSNIP